MNSGERESSFGSLHRSVESLWSGLRSPGNYYQGTGYLPFPVPENILLFYRNRFHPGNLGAETSFHYRHVLLFNLARAIRIFLDGSIVHLHRGEGLLILPYQYHRFINEGQDQLSLAFLTFEIPPTICFERLRYSPFAYTRETLQLLDETGRAFLDGSPGTLCCCAARVLSHIIETSHRRETPLHQRYHGETLIGEILKTVYHEKTRTVEALATKLGYSGSYLRTLFRKTMGQSLGRFMIEVRMTEAMRLLSRGNSTVGSIAERCGYESIYSFSRAFRSFAGESPSQYRKKRKTGGSDP